MKLRKKPRRRSVILGIASTACGFGGAVVPAMSGMVTADWFLAASVLLGIATVVSHLWGDDGDE